MICRMPCKFDLMFWQTEDGDVIDCVDIEKQPALDHPLLKGHKIQVLHIIST